MAYRNVKIALSIALLAGLAVWSATPARAQATFKSIDELGPKAAEKVVSFWNIGGAAGTTRNEYRAPFYMAGVSGWREFIEKNIVPEYQWGARRWALHNPFGNTTYGPMIFDQFIKARVRGFDWLVDDFVDAWSDFLRKHDDVELILYLGKMRDVPSFDQNLPQRPDLYLERAFESVRPILRLREFGKVAIAFDASSSVPEDHPVYHFMRLIQSMGVPVYCEAWPHRNFMHLANFGVTAAERFYQRTGLPNIHDGDQPEPHDRIPPDAFKGEVVILVTGNLANNPAVGRDPQVLAELIRDIVYTRGFTIFTPIRILVGDTRGG